MVRNYFGAGSYKTKWVDLMGSKPRSSLLLSRHQFSCIQALAANCLRMRWAHLRKMPELLFYWAK